MLRISLRDLQWRRRRFVIVVFAASLAFGLALTMAGVTNQLTHEGDTTVELFAADQWVVAAGVSGPFTTSQLIDAGLTQTVAARDGVLHASAILIGRTTIGQRDVNVVGYDPSSSILPRKLIDARTRSGHSSGAIADVTLHKAVGDRITLGGESLPIVSLVSGTGFYFSAPTVFLPMTDVQRLLFAGREVASAIVVRGMAAPFDPQLALLRNDDVRADFRRVLKSSTDTIAVINVLLWIMAAGIVAAIVYVSVLERMRDFATLKAMGTTTRSLLMGLTMQAALISLASATAAVGVCQAVAPSFSFPVSVPSEAYVRLVAIAVIVGIIASIAGVRKITRIEPALAFGGPS